ncbi:MAG: PRC-barrel domain-containing protein [Chloroflexota bacterium]
MRPAQVRITYHQLVGARVFTQDGHKVGRVTDLEAEPMVGDLAVKVVLVGPAALVQRIAFKRSTVLGLVPPLRIPWSLVAAYDGRLLLKVTAAELREHQRMDGALELSVRKLREQSP